MVTARKFTKRTLVAAVLSGLAVLFVYFIEYFHHKQNAYLNNQIEDKADKAISVVRSNLEAAIHSDIYYANSLSTLITVNPRSTMAQWDMIAAELYRDSTHLRSIGIAPDDVIQYVYPFAGNEKAIGVDFRDVPEQWETVQYARINEKIFIAGPVELIQGGKALIARMPIFTDPPFNNQYWGSASIVLDINSLFTSAGIYKLSEDYELAMRGINSSGKTGLTFLGKAAIFDNPTALETVTLPHGTWQVAISDRPVAELYPWYHLEIVRLIGYTFLSCMLLLFFMIFHLYVRATQRSLRDELTGLPNRRYLMAILKGMFKHAQKGEGRFTLLNLDLNKFKQINDTYGHIAGDYVLKEVAKRLSNTLRNGDIAARVGGDEYLILLPRVNRNADAHSIMDKISHSISAEPFKFHGYAFTVKTSIGYSQFDAKMSSVDDMLHEADRNMYFDKSKG